eukprot:TRINITY_DN28667_c0_g1_i2.p1 TRINITY_DN28667_c0_g1~~TRINITY_DN28667_c0_g1_i2.p1  ORF type:complete len:765 (+),score=197.10 TRINITY_DN28667_c0_g1_i2:122-2296(+)
MVTGSSRAGAAPQLGPPRQRPLLHPTAIMIATGCCSVALLLLFHAVAPRKESSAAWDEAAAASRPPRRPPRPPQRAAAAAAVVDDGSDAPPPPPAPANAPPPPATPAPPAPATPAPPETPAPQELRPAGQPPSPPAKSPQGGESAQFLQAAAAATVALYSEPGCTGNQLSFRGDHSEDKCKLCFDVCGKSWSDGSPAHTNAGSQVMSLRVAGAVSVVSHEQCLGTFAYRDGAELPDAGRQGSECFDVPRAGHIRVRPPPPAAAPQAAATEDVPHVKFYSAKDCKGSMVPLTVTDQCPHGSRRQGTASSEQHDGCLSWCGRSFPAHGDFAQSVRSLSVVGDAELDLFQDCEGSRYWASVFQLDGCVNIYDWPPTRYMARVRVPSLSRPSETLRPQQPPRFRVAWSGESSGYFAFQTQANQYAFDTTGQAEAGGAWIRLMTSSTYDDLSVQHPTFSAKRHPYSRRYSPLNKGDVLVKWFASPDAPAAEEIIVLIDPDNWLLKPLTPHLEGVTKGAAAAQAAWYVGNPSVTALWQVFCEKNCDWSLDLVAVPIFIHRDDLEVIAPLWRHYSLLLKERLEWDQEMLRKYHHLQVDWCAEMYGYVFAAAHAGVRHKVLPELQVRDVDSPPSAKRREVVPMIHMGRAWFPTDYGCKDWCHTEGSAWSYRGKQVWCKCNHTASDIIPWPLPEGDMDFVSRHTLRILHDSRERFGPIPASTYRSGGFGNTYP